MKVRNGYTYDAVQASLDAGLHCPEETLTNQSQAEEADINTITRRFGVTGVLPQVTVPPTYQEFQECFDFQSAQNLIVAAQRSFMELPAEVRARFGNNPAEFVDFCSEASNLDEMRRLGLALPLPLSPPSPDSPKADKSAEATK